MYTVDLHRRVRRIHVVEGMSNSEVARLFDLHRKADLATLLRPSLLYP